jgi:hypothetical protein
MEMMTEKYVQDKPACEKALPASDLSTDLDEHPRVYVHERCRGATEMPEHVRRNYLADPCYYSSFLGTVCSHCGGPVPDSQLIWTETGERLSDYMRRLRKSKPLDYHLARFLLPLLPALVLTGAAAMSMMRNGEPVNPLAFVIATLLFAAVAAIPCKFIRLFLCRMKVL